MKVKELIQELAEMNPNAEVVIGVEEDYEKIHSIERHRVFSSDWDKRVYLATKEMIQTENE
jgi:hypothetical protein